MGNWRQKTQGHRPVVLDLEAGRVFLTDYRGESETFALSDVEGATSFVLARPGSDVVYENWSPEIQLYVRRFRGVLAHRMNPYGLNNREQKAVYFAMKPAGYAIDAVPEYMQKPTAKLVADGVLVQDGAVYRTARPLINRRKDIRILGPNPHPDEDNWVLDMPRPAGGEVKPIDKVVTVDGRPVSHEGLLVIVEAIQRGLDAGVFSKGRASTARKILKGLAPKNTAGAVD